MNFLSTHLLKSNSLLEESDCLNREDAGMHVKIGYWIDELAKQLFSH